MLNYYRLENLQTLKKLIAIDVRYYRNETCTSIIIIIEAYALLLLQPPLPLPLPLGLYYYFRLFLNWSIFPESPQVRPGARKFTFWE